MEVIDDEERQSDEGAEGWTGEQVPSPHVDDTVPAVVLPRGDPDQEQPCRPGGIEDSTLAVRSGRRRVEVRAVGKRADREGGSEEGPGAPGMPPRDGEPAHDEREQDHIAERIRHVRDDDRHGTVGRVEHDSDQDGAADRGNGERSGDAVDPDPGCQRPEARPEQQEQPDVARGVEAEVEDVREGRVRRALGARVEEQPDELRDGIGADGRGECDPRTAVQRRRDGPRDRERGRDDDEARSRAGSRRNARRSPRRAGPCEPRKRRGRAPTRSRPGGPHAAVRTSSRVIRSCGPAP